MSSDDLSKLSEKEKMLRGIPYFAGDPELVAGRLRARKLFKLFNDFPYPEPNPDGPNDEFGPDERRQLLADLFGVSLEKARELYIEPPFRCDYGTNIEFKGNFYSNFGFTVLDCAKATIGTRVMLGPNVSIYCATHTVEVAERRTNLELAFPVTIGDDVWICGNVVIIGPTTIGNGVTIAAGAVVKGDFPDNVVIGGVPATIIKHLDPPPPVN